MHINHGLHEIRTEIWSKVLKLFSFKIPHSLDLKIIP